MNMMAIIYFIHVPDNSQIYQLQQNAKNYSEK
jgi:hypothetical protein